VKHAIAVLALAATLSGCATLFAGGPDQIPINTNPAGAYVYLNGEVVGQTPMLLTLDRNRNQADIRIYYPGFQPVQLPRYKHVNGWFFVNLLVWPGFIVDLITGDWQAFDDEPIIMGLMPGQGPAPYGMQPQLPQQGPYAPQGPGAQQAPLTPPPR